MAEGKWIRGLAPETPIADAARHVLELRLHVVRSYLRLTLQENPGDVEHIHQLRVGTRRAGAAIQIFADCLPDKVERAGRKQLRRLRRAAGQARDWDVFRLGLDEWRQHRTDLEYPGLDCLLGYVEAMRYVAQVQLAEAGANQPFAFDRLTDEILAAVRAPRGEEDLSLLDLAQPLLLRGLRDLEKAASKDLNNYGHLHQVRIAGKRLRYAMEVFADCFVPEFREVLYPSVEEMQETLGTANDSHVASQRLSKIRNHMRKSSPTIWKRLKPGIEGLLRQHQRRLPQERQRFLSWLTNWQQSGAEAALVAMLKTPAKIGS